MMNHSEATRLASRLLLDRWANGQHTSVVEALIGLNQADMGVMLMVMTDELEKPEAARLMGRMTLSGSRAPGRKLMQLALQQAESDEANR